MKEDRCIAMVRNGNGLFAADKFAQAKIEGIRNGKVILVAPWSPRNVKHHRKLFALLNLVIDGGAWSGSLDQLLTWLKYRTGHVDVFVSPDGLPVYAPKSINFSSMSQSDFEPFFAKALDLVCEHLLGGADKAQILIEIQNALRMEPDYEPA